MSIMDAQLLFSESQSIAGNSGTSTESTNIVYIPMVYNPAYTLVDDAPNVSGRLYLNIVCEDQDLLAAADSCALTIALYADTDDTTVTTDGDVLLTKTFTITQSAVAYADGDQLWCQPLPVTAFNQYLAVKYTKATQNLSTGKVTAWIGPPCQQGK